MDDANKRTALHSLIDCSPHEYCHEDERQRPKIVSSHGVCPQSGEAVAAHAEQAGRQKVPLQSRAKMVMSTRPGESHKSPEAGRSFHTASAQNSRRQSRISRPADHAFNLKRTAAGQTVCRKSENHNSQDRLDNRLRTAISNHSLHRNTKESRDHQPPSRCGNESWCQS